MVSSIPPVECKSVALETNNRKQENYIGRERSTGNMALALALAPRGMRIDNNNIINCFTRRTCRLRDKTNE